MKYYWTINRTGYRTSPAFGTECMAESWQLLYEQYGIDSTLNPEDIPSIDEDYIEDTVAGAIWDYEWGTVTKRG